MADFFAADEYEDGFDTETGKPGIGMAARAIQFWSSQNYDAETHCHPTVRAAAVAFKMPDAAVRAAVEWHPWMFVFGPDDDPTRQTIEHEGE